MRWKSILGLMVMTFAGGLALSASIDASEIDTCVNKKSGAIRVVSGSGPCRKTESLVQLSGPPTQVLDSSDRVIGTHLLNFNGSAAITTLSGILVVLPIDRGGSSGFLQGQSGAGFLQFWHTSPDCSGTRYLPQGVFYLPLSMLTAAIIFEQRAYFPIAPFLNLPINSVERISPGDDPTEPGQCTADSTGNTLLGLVQTGDVSMFVPPFHLSE